MQHQHSLSSDFSNFLSLSPSFPRAETLSEASSPSQIPFFSPNSTEFFPNSSLLDSTQKKLNSRSVFEAFLSEQLTKKQKRVYVKKSDEKIKRWTEAEAARYEEFIKRYNKVFENAGTKRITKIFMVMSEFIGTKTPSQCRSHHQKFYRRFKNGEFQDEEFKRRKTYKKKGDFTVPNEKVGSEGCQSTTQNSNEWKMLFSFGNMSVGSSNSQNESMQTMDDSMSKFLSEERGMLGTPIKFQDQGCILPFSEEEPGEKDTWVLEVEEGNDVFRENFNLNEFDRLKNQDFDNREEEREKEDYNRFLELGDPSFVEECLRKD